MTKDRVSHMCRALDEQVELFLDYQSMHPTPHRLPETRRLTTGICTDAPIADERHDRPARQIDSWSRIELEWR